MAEWQLRENTWEPSWMVKFSDIDGAGAWFNLILTEMREKFENSPVYVSSIFTHNWVFIKSQRFVSSTLSSAKFNALEMYNDFMRRGFVESRRIMMKTIEDIGGDPDKYV